MNRPVKTPSERDAWPLQDAKARFSEVVDAAIRGEAQHVTRRGKPAGVVVGAEEFERLARADRSATPGLIDYLRSMPVGKARSAALAPRMKLRPRDVDLSP